MATRRPSPSCSTPRPPPRLARRRRPRTGSRPRCDCCRRPIGRPSCASGSRWRRRCARPAISRAAARRLLEAIDLLPASEQRTRIALIAACAASEHFLGRHEEATRRLEAAFAGLPDPESEEAVVVLMALTAGAFFALEAEQGRASSRQALAVARALDQPILVFATSAAVAHACANAGAVDEAASALGVAADLMDGLPDDELATCLDAVNRAGLGGAPRRARRRCRPPRRARHRDRPEDGPGPVRPADRGSRGPEPAAAGRRDAGGRAAGGGARDRRGRRQRLRRLVGPDDRGPDPGRAGRSPGCARSRRTGGRHGRAPRERPGRDDGSCATRAAATRGGRERSAPGGPGGARQADGTSRGFPRAGASRPPRPWRASSSRPVSRSRPGRRRTARAGGGPRRAAHRRCRRRPRARRR